MKIYLDMCCLSRPCDDQSQPRIRVETEAVLAILDKISNHEWIGIASRASTLR